MHAHTKGLARDRGRFDKTAGQARGQARGQASHNPLSQRRHRVSVAVGDRLSSLRECLYFLLRGFEEFAALH